MTRAAPAFTLIELLAAIAIIVVLIALLIPAIGAARASATTAACSANLRSIFTATRLFADEHDRLPMARALPDINDNRLLPGLDHRGDLAELLEPFIDAPPPSTTESTDPWSCPGDNGAYPGGYIGTGYSYLFHLSPPDFAPFLDPNFFAGGGLLSESHGRLVLREVESGSLSGSPWFSDKRVNQPMSEAFHDGGEPGRNYGRRAVYGDGHVDWLGFRFRK